MLSEIRKTFGIAKLFAKHFKVWQQGSYLKNSNIHVGVGTPNRIKKLIDNGNSIMIENRISKV